MSKKQIKVSDNPGAINPRNMSRLNPLLAWLWDLLSFYSTEEIVVPKDYFTRVVDIKDIMESDLSGMVNSILDFGINSALVNYSVETPNKNLTTTLNDWLDEINGNLRGKVPTGIKSLAKEYFRERWKGSSLLVLRTQWEKVDGLYLPTKLWFIDGENIRVTDSGDNRIIGEERYWLHIEKDKYKEIPSNKDEMIFVQKPFSSWSELYPTPFLIQRGIYKNLKILELINKKGERIVGKALEYLFSIKKGTEQLALKGNADFTYSKEDLKDVKEDFKKMVNDMKTLEGIPTYTTNFDTQMEHLIPDYAKAINQALYSPIERRILAGLGLIEIVEGITSTRREGILNPKPFITEIRQGVSDFKALLNDIIYTIVEKNFESHPKHFSNEIHVYASPIKPFIDTALRDHLRSMYDRGCLSKETYIEVVGEDMEYEIERQKRKNEYDNGDEDIFYPPIIQNTEKDPDVKGTPSQKRNLEKLSKEKIPVKKQGPEKKNFKGTCEHCNKNLEENKDPKYCDDCGTLIYEEAPYKTTQDLPDNIKNVLPSEAQSLWMRVFNQSYPKGEDYARKVAWSVVKKIYKKDKDGNWVKKSKTKGSEGDWIDLENASVDEIFNDILKLKELELKEYQIKVAKQMLGKEKEDETL